MFSLLTGSGRPLGEALVAHPVVKAVGFTGSLTMGAGQFCTNPDLVIAMDSPDLQRFISAASEALAAKGAQTMLTPGIHEAYGSSTAAVEQVTGVGKVAQGQPAGELHNAAQAFLCVTDAARLLASPELGREMFGPAAIVVRARDAQEVLQLTERLEGQLTATLQVDAADHEHAARLLPVLERKVGRILANGFPTGVEVCQAMVHGGPFPSTSNGVFTSVGASAIDRFLRPVCYQDVPDALRPAALQQANPLHLWRLVEGMPCRD